MNKKIRVLLTGIGCPGGVSIIQSLKVDPNIEIIGTDMREDVPTKYLVKKFYQVPPGKHITYIGEVLDIVRKELIDVILPCATFELDALSASKEKFQDYGCEVCVSDYAGHVIANDRQLMSDLFGAEPFIPDFATPKNWKEMRHGLAVLGWPEKKVVIKPFVSHGSIGLRIVDNNVDIYDQYRNQKPYSINININQLEQIFGNREFDDILMQEYLPGQEWEVDFLLDPINHKVLTGALREQGDVIMSASEKAVLVFRDDVYQIGKEMAETLKLSYTINLSIKLAEDGTPKVTEMNPRLGAGMFLPISGGVNFPLLSVHMAMSMEIGVPKFNYGLSMYIYRGYLVMDKNGNIVNQTVCREG